MTDRTDDAIERRLRDDAARPIADDGFTARVMAALGPPPPKISWLRPALILGGTALGSALALAFAPYGTMLAEGMLQLVRFQSLTASGVAALATVGVATLSGVVIAIEAE